MHRENLLDLGTVENAKSSYCFMGLFFLTDLAMLNGLKKSHWCKCIFKT